MSRIVLYSQSVLCGVLLLVLSWLWLHRNGAMEGTPRERTTRDERAEARAASVQAAEPPLASNGAPGDGMPPRPAGKRALLIDNPVALRDPAYLRDYIAMHQYVVTERYADFFAAVHLKPEAEARVKDLIVECTVLLATDTSPRGSGKAAELYREADAQISQVLSAEDYRAFLRYRARINTIEALREVSARCRFYGASFSAEEIAALSLRVQELDLAQGRFGGEHVTPDYLLTLPEGLSEAERAALRQASSEPH